MTKFLYFFVLTVLLGISQSRANLSPALRQQHSDLNDYDLKNYNRGNYRREITLQNPGVKRKTAQSTQPNSQTQQQQQQQGGAAAGTNGPIRFGTEIFEKLRGQVGPQEVQQQQQQQQPQQQPQQQQQNGFDQSQSNARKGEFISDDPKYMLQDTSSYQEAIKSLQQILKGVQNDNAPNTNYNYNKDSAQQQQQQNLQNIRWKRKNPVKRKTRLGRAYRTGKGYLDYTNSQMPFNEGTKRSLKEQKKSESNGSDIEASKGESNYSRVRRYLDQERTRNRIKGSTTLEAKEAAMSRVLDPNLNLDGILEPHVRKRRRYASKSGSRPKYNMLR